MLEFECQVDPDRGQLTMVQHVVQGSNMGKFITQIHSSFIGLLRSR